MMQKTEKQRAPRHRESANTRLGMETPLAEANRSNSVTVEPPAMSFSGVPHLAASSRRHSRLPADQPEEAGKQILTGAAKPGEGSADLSERVAELILLAHEQGYLTYDDIHEAFANDELNPQDLEEVHRRLNQAEVMVVERAEAEQTQVRSTEEAEDVEESSRLDSLDDPVRMYMRQMSRVPLLTREGEVAICQRIEEAENEERRILYGFGFTAKEHIALAEKLLCEPPKERFDRVIMASKIPCRSEHLQALLKLVGQVRTLDRKVDLKYAEWRDATDKGAKNRKGTEFKKLDKKLQGTFVQFYFEPKSSKK